MINNIYKSISLIVFFLLLIGNALKAQVESYTLSTTLSSTDEKVATKAIYLKPGFSTNENLFHAYIDFKTEISKSITPVSYSSPQPSGNHNYIYTKEFLVATKTGTVSKTKDIVENIQYIDGLGRPVQTISLHASPTGGDIVQHIEYDDFGREAKKYLPFVIEASDGAFVTYAKKKNLDFYQNPISDDYASDSTPFAVTLFEPSPLNRVIEQGAVGTAWQPGTNHTVKMDYLTNSSPIPYWKVRTGDYKTATTYTRHDFPPASLYVSQTTNEEGFKTREYTNTLGQKVLSESEADTSVWLQTYYIYDDFGLLRCVVPPKAEASIDVDLCFFYKYDERNRMTNKKLPGAEEVILIYDQRDRLVLSQDGNQRSNNKWFFTKYDVFNRPIMTGIWKSPKNEATLRAEVAAKPENELYETLTGTIADDVNHGYTINTYPGLASTDSIYSVTYYDNYNAINQLADYPQAYQKPTGYDEVQATSVKGLATISKTRSLLTSDMPSSGVKKWTVAISFYDKYGRNIQTWCENHTGGFDILSTDYDFAGKVLKTKQEHSAYKGTSKESKHTLATRMLYDNAGNLHQTYLTVDNTEEVLLNTNKYNRLGQLKTKYQHWTTQKIDYLYNIRGWLTQMNNPDDLGFDLFAMKLDYNKGSSALSTKGLYNGNISGMTWANKQINGTSYKAAYAFNYDGANRLINAVYGEGTNLMSNHNAFNTNYSYDKNGNIDYLKRSSSGTLIDDLSYTYLGNRLTGISDAQGNKNLGDFSSTTAAYTYDANGNMSYNSGKQLDISYNALNLPRMVDNGANGKMQFVYNAAGQKLRTTLYDSPSNITDTSDYIGNFIYKNGQLSYILMPEGRILPNGSSFTYEYHLKDQLGNTRATYIAGANGNTTLTQTTAYYPFGLPINALSSNLENNPYLYNGKELHSELNLDLFDYGARYYDAEVGRWWSVDPLAEKYYSTSFYGYVENNPISYNDPNGMFKTKFGARWYKFWNGGDGIEQQKSTGEYYVYTDKADEAEGGVSSTRVFKFKLNQNGGIPQFGLGLGMDEQTSHADNVDNPIDLSELVFSYNNIGNFLDLIKLIVNPISDYFDRIKVKSRQISKDKNEKRPIGNPTETTNGNNITNAQGQKIDVNKVTNRDTIIRYKHSGKIDTIKKIDIPYIHKYIESVNK